MSLFAVMLKPPHGRANKMANDWTMAEGREIIYQNLLALDTSVMELTLRAEGIINAYIHYALVHLDSSLAND